MKKDPMNQIWKSLLMHARDPVTKETKSLTTQTKTRKVGRVVHPASAVMAQMANR